MGIRGNTKEGKTPRKTDDWRKTESDYSLSDKIRYRGMRSNLVSGEGKPLESGQSLNWFVNFLKTKSISFI